MPGCSAPLRRTALAPVHDIVPVWSDEETSSGKAGRVPRGTELVDRIGLSSRMVTPMDIVLLPNQLQHAGFIAVVVFPYHLYQQLCDVSPNHGKNKNAALTL